MSGGGFILVSDNVDPSPSADSRPFASFAGVKTRQREPGKGPEELGQAEPFIRLMDDDQHVDFELDCHPEKQNYMTVKVWGSSGSEGYRPGCSLLLHDPEKGDEPFAAIARQDTSRDSLFRTSGRTWPWLTRIEEH